MSHQDYFTRFDFMKSEDYEREMEKIRIRRRRKERSSNIDAVIMAGATLLGILGIVAISGKAITESRYNSQPAIVQAYDLNQDGELSSQEYASLQRDLARKFAHRAREVENWK
jgi:hypothetical protein